jgi:hypothetical protein
MTMIGIGVCGGINAEIRNSCESLRTGAPVAVATLLANRRPDLSIPPSPAEVRPITQLPRRNDQRP